jgi:flagellar motor switch protein FliG
MALKGIQKAAILLTTLDPPMATEMLKGQSPEVIQKIAMELAQLDSHGSTISDHVMVVGRDFCTALQKQNTGNSHIKNLISNLLQNSAGKDKAAELLARMEKTARENDPFILVSSAAAGQLAAVMNGESPQTVALVLSSIPTKLATDVLAKLDDQVSLQVAWRMTLPQDVSPKTLRRIGETVNKKLLVMNTDQKTPVAQEDTSKDNLRRVAIILNAMPKERRALMLQQILTRDPEIAEAVKALMVTWEDIIKIENKCLQGIVRKIEAGVLAKALFGAEGPVPQKIRANISERMSQMIAEETTLMGEPKKKEILEAREEVAKALRDASDADALVYIEEE